MDYKIALLVLITLIGCFARPNIDLIDNLTPSNDFSSYFDYVKPYFVVGGRISYPASHPYAVVITTGPYVRGYLCGASLISDRTVLTAAHCCDAIYENGELDKTVRVIVGTTLWALGGTAYTVERNVTHPQHDPVLRTNDICLLITDTKVEFSVTVRPIALSFDYIGAGVPSRVATWGSTRVGGDEADELQELDIDTIGGKECVDVAAQAVIELEMRAPPIDPALQVCTLHSPGRGTCNGDSGSPLIRREDNKQIGIVSWGFPCALGAPDVFTRMSAYSDFIKTWFKYLNDR